MTHRPLNQNVHEACPLEGRETPDKSQTNELCCYISVSARKDNQHISLWILRLMSTFTFRFSDDILL